MKPVLVETNWIVDVCAPPYRRNKSALALLQRAAVAELEIHVPAIAFREARDVIRRKYQPSQAKVLGEFRKWAIESGHLSTTEAEHAKVFLDKFRSLTKTALVSVEERLDEVARAPGVKVVALSDDMLERAISLRLIGQGLKPFDEALLAGILVRAESLRGLEPVFCTLDADLFPFDKQGRSKVELAALYEAADLDVRDDFQSPRA